MFCILIRVYKLAEFIMLNTEDMHFTEYKWCTVNMKNKEFKLMEDELKQFYSCFGNEVCGMYIYANCLHICLQPLWLLRVGHQGTESWAIISGQCYLKTALQIAMPSVYSAGQSYSYYSKNIIITSKLDKSQITFFLSYLKLVKTGNKTHKHIVEKYPK